MIENRKSLHNDNTTLPPSLDKEQYRRLMTNERPRLICIRTAPHRTRTRSINRADFASDTHISHRFTDRRTRFATLVTDQLTSFHHGSNRSSCQERLQESSEGPTAQRWQEEAQEKEGELRNLHLQSPQAGSP